MAIEKPTSHEDEFFAKHYAEKKKKLRAEQNKKREEERKIQAQKDHYMKCPKCGNDLEEIMHHEVAIDKCTSCDGIWLDAGELEILTGEGGGFFGKLFGK